MVKIDYNDCVMILSWYWELESKTSGFSLAWKNNQYPIYYKLCVLHEENRVAHEKSSTMGTGRRNCGIKNERIKSWAFVTYSVFPLFIYTMKKK